MILPLPALEPALSFSVDPSFVFEPFLFLAAFDEPAQPEITAIEQKTDKIIKNLFITIAFKIA